MQEPGRRPAPQFAGVDLRRPKGYPAPALQPPAAKEEQAPAPGRDPCPRCESRDTKFCYYNNYNTSQPRHFCKSCRRYWTKGGSLRNVPVGGGTRKSSSPSSSSSSPAAPKRSSKRRRLAPATDPAAPRSTNDDASNADDVADNRAPTTPAAPSAEAAATVAADDHHAAPPEEGGLKTMSVALGLGVTDVGVGREKQELLPEPGQFEWPSSCDLGSFWGSTGVFADTDPAQPVPVVKLISHHPSESR